MAHLAEALAALEEYRAALLGWQRNETPGRTGAAFAARGAFGGSWATPLANVHATGVGLRLRDGRLEADDFVLKVYVFDKQPLGARTPSITGRDFHGVGIDVEYLPVQRALPSRKVAGAGAGAGAGVGAGAGASAGSRSRAARAGAVAKPASGDAAVEATPEGAAGRPARDAGGTGIAPRAERGKPPKAGARQNATTIAQHQQRRRPIVGGIQIAPIGASFVGTLGGLVRRDDRLYALSNNHVLADTNRLPIGTRIGQPSGADPADAFASLADVEPIRFPEADGAKPRNRMDAAIAAITDPRTVAAGRMLGIPGYTAELLAARPGQRVVKAGRTTGVTRGVVTAIRVNGIVVNYGSAQSPVLGTFDNCVQIGGEGFSAPGDSGSVILEEQSGRPIALLFAGDGRSTSACDLTAVCARFEVVPA